MSTTAAAQPKSQGGMGRSARPTKPWAEAAAGNAAPAEARPAASAAKRLMAPP